MNGDGHLALALPRPGRGLKAVLIALLAVGVVESLFYDRLGLARLVAWLVCDTDAVLHGQVWRLFTAGVLTDPHAIGPLVYTLLGLYFFSPDLETRWGTARFLRFLGISTLAGFGASVVIDRLAPASLPLFHPGPVYGAFAAITATSIAWARMNARARVRLFFVLPVSGAAFLWITLGYCVVNLVWPTLPEGAVAPFGGAAVGLLLVGDPSPLRRAWLHARLAYLRRIRRTPTAHEIAFGKPPARKAGRRGETPVLRVLQGGLDEDLSKRNPPKDKRYLN